MPAEPLGDAQRDGLAAALGRHYVEGRLDALDDRLARVYAADATADAADALSDLPALGPPAAPRRRRWGRRHGEADIAGNGWVPTTERFVDPSTDRVMRVWLDPASGARHYVAELGPTGG